MLKEHLNRPKRGKELWSSMKNSIQSRVRKPSITSEAEIIPSDSDGSSIQSNSSTPSTERRRSGSFVNKLKVWIGSSPNSPNGTTTVSTNPTPTTPTKCGTNHINSKTNNLTPNDDLFTLTTLTKSEDLYIKESYTKTVKCRSKTSLTIDTTEVSLASVSPLSDSGLYSPISDDEPHTLWNNVHQAIDRGDRTVLSNIFITRNPSSVLQVLLTFSYSNHDKIYRHELEIMQDADELLGKSVENLNALQIACMLGDEELGLDILQYVAYESEKMDAKKVLYEFMSRVWGGGNTALHLASFLGMADLVKKLLDLGANTNKRNDRKYKPVDCADDDETRALFMNLFEVVRYPLKRTYSVDEAYARRRREQPTGKAASMGPAGGKKIGLSRETESSLEVKNLSPFQHIKVPSNFKHNSINSSLTSIPITGDAICESDVREKHRSTPTRPKLGKKQVSFDPCTLLTSSARLGDLNEVKRVLEEVHIDCLTPNYQTPHSLLSPLHLAASYCHLGLCKYLVSVGADVNIQDAEGWTPLHCAAAEGHMKILQFLLDVDGVDVNILNEDDETIMDVVEEDTIREYLEEQLGYKDTSSVNTGVSQGTLDNAEVEHDDTIDEDKDRSCDRTNGSEGRYTGARAPYSLTKSSLQRNRLGYMVKSNEVTSHG